jgi:hypothetical protein
MVHCFLQLLPAHICILETAGCKFLDRQTAFVSKIKKQQETFAVYIDKTEEQCENPRRIHVNIQQFVQHFLCETVNMQRLDLRSPC